MRVVLANTQFATVRFLSLSFFLSFFGLFVTRTGHISGLILRICTSFDVFSPKDVLFECFINMPPQLWGQIPNNPNLGGVNRRFRAKLVKSEKMHVCVCMYVCIVRAGVQPTLDPYAEAFI